MKTEEIKKELSNYSKYAPLFHEGMATTAACTHIFMKLFNGIPNAIDANNKKYKFIKKSLGLKEPWINVEKLEKENEKYLDYHKLKSNISIIKIHEAIKEESYLLELRKDFVLIAERLIVWSSERWDGLTVFTEEREIPEIVSSNLVYEEKPVEYNINYLTVASYGINPIPLKIDLQNLDLSRNYNDDLPHKEICDFINSEKSGLCLLHGLPGTGKTTYIKHLVTNTDKTIYYMDSTILNGITDSKFIDFLADTKNSIFLIEDCEDLLQQRVNGNSRLASLLNLSDGILGDAFKLKFICTFNADVGKIDEALLRKGRTQVFYEFKPLATDKCNVILQELGINETVSKPTTIADIYNIQTENIMSDVNNSKKIGF